MMNAMIANKEFILNISLKSAHGSQRTVVSGKASGLIQIACGGVEEWSLASSLSRAAVQKPLPNTRSPDDTTFIALSAGCSMQEPISVFIFPRTITDWNQLSREHRQSLHCSPTHQ